MVGQLVLWRHGIAEDRIAGLADAERALTKAGREKVKKIVPGLAPFLTPALDWLIMTSPLRRADETARLAGRRLGLEVVTLAALAQGDWPEVTEALLARSAREGVLLVGHEPFLSECSKLMTGLALPFKKGAAAGYQFQADVNGCQASLRWFVQPRELMRLGEGAS